MAKIHIIPSNKIYLEREEIVFLHFSRFLRKKHTIRRRMVWITECAKTLFGNFLLIPQFEGLYKNREKVFTHKSALLEYVLNT
jgi:hypothetical protein